MSRSGDSSTTIWGHWNRLVVIIVGALLVSWGGPAASAFWSSVSSNQAAAQADAVAAGAKPVTAVSGSSVTVTWAASTTTAGRPVSGYSISRYDSASGGIKVPAAGTCSGTITGLGCTDSNVPTGTWYYAVTPSLSLWQGAESARSAATPVDATPPPAPVLTVPAYVNLANVNSVPVSGTAEAGSSVALTVSDAGAAHSLTQTVTANGSGAWTAAPVNLAGFAAGAITYSARATDAAGNIGPAGTASSTKDVAVPTVAAVQLNNGGSSAGKIEKGDTVTITFSEALSANTICSTWTSDTITQTQNGNNANQVVVNVSSTNVLTVTGAGCPTLRIGSVALGSAYTSSSLTYSGNGGNASILQWNPATKALTITLGAGPTSPGSAISTPAAASYTPASGLTDIAGNALATTQVAGTPSRF
ncbi:hypothetical protein ACIQC5_17250 [Paenarthrobacter sp. NPDC092416]|uniref:hypothetical protein n=1 Tax=Paenarthrobacter sp. NPDC092416 TaxID=3364386 RepID=UPI003810D10F